MIDCDKAIDVADGWILSGVHRSPTPHITIVTASLPQDGNYTAYMEAGTQHDTLSSSNSLVLCVSAKERRKQLMAAAESGGVFPVAVVE